MFSSLCGPIIFLQAALGNVVEVHDLNVFNKSNEGVACLVLMKCAWVNKLGLSYPLRLSVILTASIDDTNCNKLHSHSSSAPSLPGSSSATRSDMGGQCTMEIPLECVISANGLCSPKWQCLPGHETWHILHN